SEDFGQLGNQPVLHRTKHFGPLAQVDRVLQNEVAGHETAHVAPARILRVVRGERRGGSQPLGLFTLSRLFRHRPESVEQLILMRGQSVTDYWDVMRFGVE